MADAFARLNFGTWNDTSTSGQQDAHLPDAAVRSIATYLVQNEPPGHALVHLLAFCGVCKQWRAVAREVNPGVCIGFDVLENTFCNQSSIQRFRRLNMVQKEEVFYAAAGLLVGMFAPSWLGPLAAKTGYTEICFSGEAVSDRLVLMVAQRVGAKLVKSFMAEELDRVHVSQKDTNFIGLSGTFLEPLLEGCQQLTTAHVANIPSLNWTACKKSCEKWGPKCLTKLVVRTVGLDESFGIIMSRLGNLTDLELDGPAVNIKAGALHCPALSRVSYLVGRKSDLDEALPALQHIKELKQLELIVRNFILTAENLRHIGALPVADLRLDSYVYKQQPTLSRSSYSHVDNEGVKALVDGICNRWSQQSMDMCPMKLSLCGATALTHDAVSALLRLPVLTELDIGGCCRITAMDKMRLVAKCVYGEWIVVYDEEGGRTLRARGEWEAKVQTHTATLRPRRSDG
ncbi:hypothetical protein VOLCADRAFT_100415 [Volvox carteri f. nagariensis]|uniref:F-box domain-containing protein n=1 Tax=Volvox carteri f. nagariensis TaxID=3068 RepID=D8UK56_VOLCA|nr:uncharacterized protein VOLCADRAFT_100415 [Volvox carteri f. nagariensis]EFJ39893.1 hypothetical protein VOLCADRAFT_100415 [Volvox carteri f. nagariensis]|eukprot:XP_002959032.1 hypothetical protein VOLCADRAFT_100415 [Volvox carteri f. nagariensis]